ncbi:NAD(P)-dependent alcohol dehydrogenase [Gottfriedia acidiceleris]|uniref:NAD(P)-dependent alcohol dehydrogenase n=1 Tax=Bacillaceae TaxID=186817 RepID=UPI000BED4A07|nr:MULTISPECIES: NAD(P)-dependent alcohol dehydrogenase [unclassified Bacillus (in: firmicutes)]PEC46416.1 NAD(P)-dependent alcohol dehydrogenase [Bacillus sp. AFS096315]PFM74352.1 NAD(P)-dependent alcohol dehydrogenase [Bacillus sp. AFS077874]
MKAIICTKYGPPEVLQTTEVEKPKIKDDEVLIKIHATTVTAGDVKLRSSDFPFMYWLPSRLMFGLTKPKNQIPGCELAGEIVTVGKNVRNFKTGDQVFGYSGFTFGANAEYISLHEEGVLAKKPINMSFEQAAAVPVGALTALHFLRRSIIQNGQKVLIYGASGSVGTYAIQLAKYFGTEVTALCSTSNLELVRALGANEVIDYTNEDFAKSKKTYDIIFDTVGKSSFPNCKRLLNKDGVYLLSAVWKLSVYFQAIWSNIISNKKTILGVANMNYEDLNYIKALIEADKLKAVIDRQYPLEQIVEAHRYVEKGHKKGNVVINIRGVSDC